MNSNKLILEEMLFQLKSNLLDKWYPKAIDANKGGYFTNLTYDFELKEEQEKMLVTQARHVWTLSKASSFFDNPDYKEYAIHGYNFLANKMWDQTNGGYYQIRNREGNLSDVEGWHNEKRVYGNAYGLFGLAALYKVTLDNDVNDACRKVFNWIESTAHDEIDLGYFQFFTEKNKLFDNQGKYRTKASDAVEVGYKDQNSSIHLLEAFTEYYSFEKNETLKIRLQELLEIIRDKITTEKGYLSLFLSYDWTPISFKDSPKEIREANYRLDHVSFGHDYETAFLMLEASYILGIENDLKTLRVAKKMIDHALNNGWDEVNGGFFDGGYYFAGEDKCTITKNSKNWWAQAEALNILLLMSRIFPEEEKYYQTFQKVWEYVKKYIIDDVNGGWYWGGIDKQPHHKNSAKGEIWKGTYHNGRALMNCIAMLSEGKEIPNLSNPGFKLKVEETSRLIDHWRHIAKIF